METVLIVPNSLPVDQPWAEIISRPVVQGVVRSRIQDERADEKAWKALAQSIVLSSPPADWGAQRRREYLDWSKQVVDALPAPNQMLKVEFERLYREAETLESPMQRNPSAD